MHGQIYTTKRFVTWQVHSRPLHHSLYASSQRSPPYFLCLYSIWAPTFSFLCGTLKNRSFPFYFSQFVSLPSLLAPLVSQKILTLESIRVSCVTYKSTEAGLFKCESLINLVLVYVWGGENYVFSPHIPRKILTLPRIKDVQIKTVTIFHKSHINKDLSK